MCGTTGIISSNFQITEKNNIMHIVYCANVLKYCAIIFLPYHPPLTRAQLIYQLADTHDRFLLVFAKI